ncbi:chromosomal replication initiator protein DnaA, partial [Candidatus Berkelbacteria bacterium]|nr:chromosomal replication initiator protein DnaA [Candidatus Berkelbacteria bacterium]
MSTSTTTDPITIWKTTLGELEVEISPANFRTWFKNTKIININDEGVVVGVPNTFAQDWLRNKYHNQIMDSLKRFVPSLKRIEYQVSTGHQPEPEPEPDELPVAIKPTNQEDKPTAELNASYKFETFVVGNANRLAHAAATAIAKNPGEARYNPLYLYGGVGLGKTHLM